ncbi:MAG: polymer-forming cytoskeletal protein [Chloroflexi bacterium]|nr:polymer-forming cytoskeletal protein [Chloroflexota bacterium]
MEGRAAARQNSTNPSDLSAHIGPRSEFEGKLSFAGTVRIEGKFDGQIVTNDLVVVTQTARISADITCGTLVSEGVIQGSVRASTSVELHPPARLKGNVITPSLTIEKGVIFDGSSKMEDLDEAASQPTPFPKAYQAPYRTSG